MHGGGANKLRTQIAKVMKADKKKMIAKWRDMLKTVLSESESTIKKVLSKIITAV